MAVGGKAPGRWGVLLGPRQKSTSDKGGQERAATGRWQRKWKERTERRGEGKIKKLSSAGQPDQELLRSMVAPFGTVGDWQVGRKI